MRVENRNALQAIIEAIDNFVTPKLEVLKYDRTYRAKILVNKGNGLYTVSIKGNSYDIQTNTTNLKINSIVKVKSPLNNFSDIYIENEPVDELDNLTINNNLNCDSLQINGQDIFNILHPIGDIMIKANDTDYSNYLGFTWEKTAIGRVLVGKDGTTEFHDIGQTGGAKTHTLTTAQIPVHSHTTKTNIVHSDGELLTAEYINAGIAWGQCRRRYSDVTDSAGSGQAHNNLQPYQVVNYWKRTL